MKQLKLFLLIAFCCLFGSSALAQPENLYIIGGPFNSTGSNWLFRDIVQLEKDTENPNIFYYRGYIGANTSGHERGAFKVLTSNDSWGGYHPEGSVNQLIGAEQVGVPLNIREGGDDTKWEIPEDGSADGYYEIKINTENNTFLIENFTPAEATVTVGLFLVGGPFIIDALGWNPSESVKMERDNTDPDIFHFHDYMELNQWGNNPGYFKILIDQRNWGNEFHPEGSDDLPFTGLNTGTPSTLVKTDDKKWYLPEDGSGNGYWNFTVDAKEMTLTVNEFIHDFDYFDEVYIAGDAMPNGWTTDNPAVMSKVSRGVYSWKGIVKAGDFKFLKRKSYDGGCYVATTENEPVVVGESNSIIYEKNYMRHESGKDYKFIINEEDAGKNVTITLDLNTKTMTVANTNTTGTDEVEGTPVDIFTSTGKVFINGMANEACTVQIYTIEGKQIMQRTFTGNAEIELQPGCYLISLSKGSGIVTKAKVAIF